MTDATTDKTAATPPGPRPQAPTLRPDAIPDALKTLGHWVLWGYDLRNAKWTKPPRAVSSGRAVSIHSPDARGDWDAALAGLTERRGACDGIGLVLAPDTGLWALDADRCVHPVTGVIDPDVTGFLDACRAAGTQVYAEFSPSRLGVRVLFRVTGPGLSYGASDYDAGEVLAVLKGGPRGGSGGAGGAGAGGDAHARDLYGPTGDRYVTLTGHALDGYAGAEPGAIPADMLRQWRDTWRGVCAGAPPGPDQEPSGGGAGPGAGAKNSQPPRAPGPPADPARLPELSQSGLIRAGLTAAKADALLTPLPPGNRSETYFGVCSSLSLSCGLTPSEILWVLENAPGSAAYLSEKAAPRDWAWRYLVWPAVGDSESAPGRLAAGEFGVVTDSGATAPVRHVWHGVIGLTATERTGPIPSHPELIDGMIPLSAGGLVSGGGMGKTTLTLYEAIHITLGWPLYGRAVSSPGRVLFVTGEDSRADMIGTLRRLCDGMFLGPAEQAQVFDSVGIEDVSTRTVRMVAARAGSGRGGQITRTAAAEELCRVYAGAGVTLVNLDNLALLGPGEEHGNDGAAEMMRSMRHLSTELGCAVQVIHHTGQQVARESLMDQYVGRGGSAFADNGRYLRQVVRLRPERVFRVEGVEWEVPPQVLDSDLEAGNGLMVLHHKHTYRPRIVTPLILRRRNFQFSWYFASKHTP